jgi:hypothetical protein
VRTLSLRGLLALLALACSGCHWLDALDDTKAKTLDMEVVFEVQKDGRYPVAGALVSTASRSLGASDRDGRLLARLRGTAGERLALQVRCPSGYYTASAPESLAIRPVLSLAGAEAQRLNVPIACEATERSIAILVRAETQPNLPVIARGQEVARTDADGLAHVLLAGTPGEELSVEIVTSAAPALRPQSPRRQFRIGNQDEVFVMHEKFSVRKPPAPRRPRVVHAPQPELPYAL